MKILYVTDSLVIWGGLQRILVEKANSLAEKCGYDIYIVTSDQGNHAIPYPLSSLVHFQDLCIQFHHQYKYRGFRRLYEKRKLQKLYEKRLKSCIDEINPDIIVCVRIHLLKSLLKVKGSIPLVVESHSMCKSYLYDEDNVFRRLMARYEIHRVRKALKVVALTQGDAKDWQKINSNVCVIPNIVHLNDSGMLSECSAKKAIYVGRFSKQKDIDVLIKIWTLVHLKHPDWQLYIYGGYCDQYDHYITILENNDINIIVNEPTPHIIQRYLDCSMLLLTSLYEPFGLVLPEAMSCGLPVISFDCPYGPADIITDGVDGFLVPDREVSLYAEKVCMLIENSSLRKSMGKAGVLSSQRFSADRIMPKWKSIFEQVVKESNS